MQTIESTLSQLSCRRENAKAEQKKLCPNRLADIKAKKEIKAWGSVTDDARDI